MSIGHKGFSKSVVNLLEQIMYSRCAKKRFHKVTEGKQQFYSAKIKEKSNPQHSNTQQEEKNRY